MPLPLLEIADARSAAQALRKAARHLEYAAMNDRKEEDIPKDLDACCAELDAALVNISALRAKGAARLADRG